MTSPLTFPTLAEQALTRFHTATKTISLVTCCMELGAVRSDQYPWRIFDFNDDSTLRARGAGRNLRVETLHP